VVKEDELEVVLHDRKLVDPSGVYLDLLLVVIPAVAFSAKVRMLKTVSVGVVPLCS
jgi:hypothetical protein